MAIEGVLTRQKCAETPYATFWHPPLKDLVPQKAISSLVIFFGISVFFGICHEKSDVS
jgi:hypothetical protein